MNPYDLDAEATALRVGWCDDQQVAERACPDCVRAALQRARDAGAAESRARAAALEAERDEARAGVRSALGLREKDKERIRALERHVLALGIRFQGHHSKVEAFEAAMKEVGQLMERDP
jgi:hypothetical protein